MEQIARRAFFFVRHAETDWNQQKLCQGQRDIPLNEEGQREAKRFANSTRECHLECIISSPLTRAVQTAQELCEIHQHAHFHLLPELSERNWGELEGISSQKMYAIEELENQDASYDPGHQVESRKAFRQRVHQGIIKAQSIHSHPLLVSHGRVFTELCHLLKMPVIQQLPNCQLVKLVFNSNQWEFQLM